MANQLTVFSQRDDLNRLVSKQELNLAFTKRCLFINSEIVEKQTRIADTKSGDIPGTQAGIRKQEEDIIQLQNELSDINYFLSKWGE